MKNNLIINQKLQNFIFLYRIDYLLIIGICTFLLGIKIFLLHPNHINPDPYAYIAIANYYLYTPSPQLKDAYTVGPVIPALFFITKKAFIAAVGFGFSDVKLLKIFTFINYIFICLLAYRFQKSIIGNYKSILFICLLFGLMKIDTDTLSINGELFGVFLILLIMNIGQIKSESHFKTFFISFFSVITLYTKIQLIPILCLAALSEIRLLRERVWIVAFSIFIFSLAELYLYQNGIGFFKSINQLLSYIIHGFSPDPKIPYEISFILKNKLDHLISIVVNLNLWFPIFGFIVISLLVQNQKIKDNFFSGWILWFFFTVLSIFIPQKGFPHYFILVIPFCVKFFPESFNLINLQNNIKMKYFIFLCLILIATSKIIDDYRNIRILDSGRVKNLLNIPDTKELIEVKKILQDVPGNVFVHGWDYKVNSFLQLPDNNSLPEKFILHRINNVDYINIVSQYDYIIDIVNYSGLIRDKNLSLASKNSIWYYNVERNYNLIFNENNLYLYKKKNHNFISTSLSQRTIDDSLKLKESLNSCHSCFPIIQDLKGLISNSQAIGTYSKDGDSGTGYFKITYDAKSLFNEVKYVVGPSVSGLDIGTKTYCKDGAQITNNISLENIQLHKEYSFFIQNRQCNMEHTEITFTDNGKSFGQWIGFLGLYKY